MWNQFCIYTFWTPVAAVLIIAVLVVGCFKSWAVTMWFCKSITELQSWRQMWQVLLTMFKLLVKFWLSMAIIWDSMIKEFFVAATLILINVPFHVTLRKLLFLPIWRMLSNLKRSVWEALMRSLLLCHMACARSVTKYVLCAFPK